jgi:AcrR family transcriptional regulator
MPRPSQEATILAAALSCFAEHGYEATRIRQIAERAKVSEGALYRHYPSKEAVAQALFTTHFGAYSARIGAIVATETSVQQQIAQIVTATLAMYRDNPAAIGFVLLRQTGFAHQLPAGVVAPIDVLAAVMQRGQTEGVIRPGAPLLLAAIVFGCILRPIIVAQLADPGALDLLHETHHDAVIAEAAWRAIAAEPV